MKLRNTKNLFVLCLSFLCMFSAFGGLTAIQSTVNCTDGLGTTSQMTIYIAMVFSVKWKIKNQINRWITGIVSRRFFILVQCFVHCAGYESNDWIKKDYLHFLSWIHILYSCQFCAILGYPYTYFSADRFVCCSIMAWECKYKLLPY